MAVRTLASLGIGAAIAVAILLGVAVPGVVHAQMLKCENDWLYNYDEMALRAAALRALPKSVHLVVTGACRNTDWSYGFIETRKSVTPEGVQQWYELTCRRQGQPWKCDPPQFKQLIPMTVVVSGVSHPVELRFAKDASLERARVLASGAIDAYLDPTSLLPSCGVSSLEEAYRLRAQSSLSPLPSGEKAIHVSVSNDGKETVALDDVNVRIDFRPNADTGGSEAACWWQLVVVT